MSKQSRQFQVPDALANLYDFANTLDLRHFTHHGVPHQRHDELAGAADLAAWMAQRKLLAAGAKVTPALFEIALGLRASLRDYLQHDPAERRNKGAARALNAAIAAFPLHAELGGEAGARLHAVRDDALAGLSVLAAELYDGARNGSLDRLKMCAAEECRRVFFDRSKPATRRWCMSILCGNRIKTRAYRERQRGVD
ncbi:CGNR zinc finger domain-containing protein [Bradyrhizobium sp.]|uniref:CGNR zinc finger domain-containing protein n=1 Tax=Bradyrhizobium sp. TaxID=376 RepID=UPI0025C6A675|nr:CGNR zinc finger domain-containing protein [Bradyrhizobium sp.]MBV8923612.1 CGNR zinc finger domain-containing protein [Bradyrhizobium sp.]